MLLRWLVLTSNLKDTSWGETGCLGNPYFLFTGYLGIQFYNSSFFQQSQLGYLWLPILTFGLLPSTSMAYRKHAFPLVTKCFLPNLYIGKQIISLGMPSILSMCLCSHISLVCNQLLIIGNWDLRMSKPKLFYLWWKI